MGKELQKKETQNLYRQLVENQKSLIVKFDVDGHLLYANPAYLETFDKTKEELIGKQFFSLIHDDDISEIKKSLRRTLSSPYTTQHRERVQTIDGWRWYSWHATGITNENGEVESIISIGYDITEQVRAEEKLKQSEEIFRASFEDSAVGMAIVDKTGQFISVNESTCKNFGYSKKEFLTLNFLQITHPDDVAFSKENFEKCLQDKQPYTIEKRYLNKAGEIIVGLTSVSPIFDADGNLLHLIAHMQDITQRKHYEEALLKERNKAQLYLDIAEVMILMLDNNKNITLANRKCCEVLGYDEEDQIIGKDWTANFIPKHELDEVKNKLDDIIQGNVEVFEYAENAILTKDGEERIIAWHNAALTNPEGQITGILSSGQDITDRVQAEQAIRSLNKELEQRVAQRTDQLKEANRELEAFSYSVSHDLQAPVRAIRGFSQIIEMEYSDTLPEGALVYLDRIKKSTIKMYQLIDGLLDLSRMGRKTLTLEDIEIDPLAEKIYEELATMEENREILFSTNTNKTITGDKEMISILLRNLISNALKYTRLEEKAVIELGYKKIVDTDTQAFFISDNGIGFDMEFSDKLFQPFQRLHGHEIFEGTGIGLSLIKRILLHHNGNIWVYAEEGKGTTFYFTIGDLEPHLLEDISLPHSPK